MGQFEPDMPPPDDAALRFVLKMALRKSLKLVKGLRKQIINVAKRLQSSCVSFHAHGMHGGTISGGQG
jgi:hypothetical protein